MMAPENEMSERLERAGPAIDAAIREFAAIEQSYRNPHGAAARRFSKSNRQAMAARYAQWGRDLAALRALTNEAA